MRRPGFIIAACYHITPPKRETYLELYLKSQLLKGFFENQFCMFQPLKGAQNLDVFKAVWKLASSQLWLSMQIWAGSTKETLTSFPPSARFSAFSCARSAWGVVLFLKDLHVDIFKNSPRPQEPLFLRSPSALVFSSVCSSYGTICSFYGTTRSFYGTTVGLQLDF